jgi:hypothetical protein
MTGHLRTVVVAGLIAIIATLTMFATVVSPQADGPWSAKPHGKCLSQDCTFHSFVTFGSHPMGPVATRGPLPRLSRQWNIEPSPPTRTSLRGEPYGVAPWVSPGVVAGRLSTLPDPVSAQRVRN